MTRLTAPLLVAVLVGSAVSVPVLSLTPATLPGGAFGSPYVHSLTASGGTPPYSTPSLVTGTVPPGTTFGPGAALFGFTPGSPATFSFTLSMTDSGAGSTTQSYSFAILSPNSAVAIGGTPQSATVNQAFGTALSLHVADSLGAAVEGAQVTFTAPGSGASGTFTGSHIVFTDLAGNASVAITANTVAGAYSVTTAIPGIASPPSFSLTNLAGSPASIVASAGTPQSATVGMAFATSLQAVVRDGSNNPVSSATVTFTQPGSGASGTFAGGVNTAVTNASGVATAAAFTANTTSGSYTVAASTSGVGSPANFSLTNTASFPANVSAIAGTGQSAPLNTLFPTALKAFVSDPFGNPVSGAVITFVPPASGPGGAFTGSPIVSTDSLGVATAPPFTANSTPGSYLVTAGFSAPGLTRQSIGLSVTTFSLTNLVDVPALNGWVLFVLSLLLAGIATYALRRRVS